MSAFDPKPVPEVPMPEAVVFPRQSSVHLIEGVAEFKTLSENVSNPSGVNRLSAGLESPSKWSQQSTNGHFGLRLSRDIDSYHVAEVEGHSEFLKGLQSFWLGAKTLVRNNQFVLEYQGGVAHQLHHGVNLGLRGRFSLLGKTEKAPIDVSPYVSWNLRESAGDLAWESVGRDNVLRFAGSFDTRSENNKVPKLAAFGQLNFKKRGLTLGACLAWRNFWIFERHGLLLQREFLTDHDTIGVYGKFGPLTTRMLVARRLGETTHIGMELESDDTNNSMPGIDKASLFFGVSADRRSSGFIGIKATLLP